MCIPFRSSSFELRIVQSVDTFSFGRSGLLLLLASIYAHEAICKIAFPRTRSMKVLSLYTPKIEPA